MAPSRIPIGLVLTSFDPGGTERQMIELIRRLSPCRFAVHVACFRREGAWLSAVETSPAVELMEFPLRGFASLSAAGQLIRFARWCRQRRLALVHACDFYGNVFALPAATLARVPVRIGSRRDLTLPGRSDAQHAAQRAAYACAHRVVANSQAAADQLQEEGLAGQLITVIPNGLDVSRHVPGVPSRPPRITTVANLRPEKGHDVLIAAATLVLRQRPDVIFDFVGSGPARTMLESQVAAAGIAHGIRFLGHRNDVPDLLRDSTLFVLPSRSEALPNGVLEAMAAGLPVVASRVGGLPELITEGRTGLLVPPGDPEALAAAILDVLEHPNQARSLGAAARAAVEETYSFERMVSSFETLYESALQGSSLDRVSLPSRATG